MAGLREAVPGIALARATHDVGLALAIPDWTTFDALRHRSGVRFDLTPLGGVEQLDGSIARPPEHAEVVGVLGFAEARASAIRVGHSERLYCEAAHLLGGPAFDYRVAGTWLAGCDACSLISRHSQRSDLISSRLTSVLAQESDADGPLRLVGEVRGIDPEFARRLLAAFLADFSGRRIP